ncbi:MAG: TldD/PmbA family protein [Candidatus Aminicenantes bacterium]|nr:TldD/PmbA family protein [Candidatus Aminicenantes bacterium]
MNNKNRDYKVLAEELVRKCLKKGADAAEVYIEAGKNLNVEVRNGEVETVQEASSRGVGFRILRSGKMAFSSCNEFTEEALEATLSGAIEFAQSMTPDAHNELPEDEGTTSVDGLFDPMIGQVSMEKKIEMVKSAEDLAMKDPRITKSAGAIYNEYEGRTFIANSNGISTSTQSSVCAFGVSVVAERGEQKSSGSEYCTRRFYADLEPVEKIAEKAARNAYEMLDPQMVDTQKAAVIFDPDVAFAILGGILGAIDGERVLQGASFLRESLDKQIASELVTIIDDGTLPKGLGSRPFDGEGVPTQRRVIVSEGILKSFLYNTIVANRAGVQSTGNASRDGYTGLPGIGPHNFYMAAGKSTPEEIIKTTKKGLYLKGVTGYGINPVTGDFSGGASGFWIENGKIAFPVKGLTIAGTAHEMFNGIDMVGADLDLNRSFTTPTFRIPIMQIGGK